MTGDHGVQAFQRLLLNHQAAAAVAIGFTPFFFARLEEQAYFPRRSIRHFIEQLGDAEQHGGMRVMAAGVHQAGGLRFVGDLVRFLDRQGIHIGANANRRPPFADPRHHARLRHADFGFDAHVAQGIRDQPRSPLFFKTQLRVHVNIAPPLDQLLLHFIGFFQNRHGSVLMSRLCWHNLTAEPSGREHQSRSTVSGGFGLSFSVSLKTSGRL